MELSNACQSLALEKYSQASVTVDPDAGVAIMHMNPSPRPCFTMPLLHDIRTFQKDIARTVREDIKHHGESPIKFVVLASGMDNYFNLGGDLNSFITLIAQQDRDTLLKYAKACIKDGYEFAVNLNLPVTSVALVEGTAQGGGFEAALSCNVIIAERGVNLGFPEVLFNLFPGMGAYTFLARRINMGLAERLILSGNLYPAERLYEMGVIDILAEPGEGKKKLYEYIRSAKRASQARQFINFTRTRNNPDMYNELMEITEMWVDCALKLEPSSLRTMQRLVSAQNRQTDLKGTASPPVPIRHLGG